MSKKKLLHTCQSLSLSLSVLRPVDRLALLFVSAEHISDYLPGKDELEKSNRQREGNYNNKTTTFSCPSTLHVIINTLFSLQARIRAGITEGTAERGKRSQKRSIQIKWTLRILTCAEWELRKALPVKKKS